MNRRMTTTLMFTILAGSAAVVAQTPAPNAGTAAPVAAISPAPARAAAEANRANADARNCLGFSTNLEVIKCAEKYLQRKRKG